MKNSLLAGMAIIVALVSAPVYASSLTSEIQSNGEAKAVMVPNIATINFSVLTTDADSKKAVELNNQKMEKVLKVIKPVLAEKDTIKTSNYSLQAKYEYSKKDGKSILKGYEVRNTVNVKVYDTAKASKLIGLAVSNGANSVDSLNFQVENADAVCNQLIHKASVKAKANAENVANALGVKVDKVKTVSYSCSVGNNSNLMKSYAREALAADSVTTGAPIEAGEIKINANVYATFWAK